VDHPQEFLRICRKNGLRVDAGQFELVRQYVDLLSTWNSKINLVSRRDVENIWFSHILHSLAPWFHVWLPSGRAILDIGSGGGLPGIPLAILRTDLSIVLLDSIQKKTKALTKICTELELPNVQVLNGRAEDVGTRGEYASRFSAVLARGVAPLVDLIRWSRPFLRRQEGEPTKNGEQRDWAPKKLLDAPCLLAWKGGDLEDEIEHASRKFHRETIDVLPLVIEGGHSPGFEKKQLVVVSFA
jgi:16S rRNA (guanine527-N7)-methyltransferase